jgi:RIO-like serine/threonine protein kinase
MPSLLELCGVEAQPPRPFHGQSLVPLITGTASAQEREAQWEKRVMVTDTQRVPRPVKWRNSCVMRGKLRMIDGRELYDLATDPGQRQDIASTVAPPVLAELRASYEVSQS